MSLSEILDDNLCAFASEVYGSVSVCVSVCVDATAAQGSMKGK